jgi:hypothetical protein
VKKALERLAAGGFTYTAAWRRNGQAPPVCDGVLPKDAGVYVFVQNDSIYYVGAAERSLHSRIKSYERRQRDQSAGRPVHTALASAVTPENPVEIWTRIVKPAHQKELDGLPINCLIGLEKGLIDLFDPDWNRRGRKR